MPGAKRAAARVAGERMALVLASAAGREVHASRERRRMSQEALALTVGLSRSRLAEIEAGRGAGAPLEVWLALAQALGRYLRFEFARDPQQALADAGHLDIQELVLRVTKPAGWERFFEASSRSYGSSLSVDVKLVDRRGRRLVIGECWNSFGDLGASTRSSERKLRDAEEQVVAIAGDGPPFQVGLVWIVRDTKANRALAKRYPQIFEARFPGSSAQWLRALAERAASVPGRPGLVWCDIGATRVFARRRTRG